MLYLVGLTITIGMSSMQYGIAVSATGPVVAALKYQLNWGSN